MAVASPIVVNSSSPNSFRIPSITPPSLQRSSTKLISSSPRLASPSGFVEPRAPSLKSGSRAAQIPKNGNRGFASAASLWRLNGFENERNQTGYDVNKAARRDDDENETPSKCKRTAGKLVKPKKVAKKQESVQLNKEDTPRITLGGAGHLDKRRPESISPSRLAPLRVQRSNADDERSARLSTPTRRPSVDLSEFEFHIAKEDNTIKPSNKPLEGQKKPRKRPAKPATGDVEAPVKKPRRRKKKSESIILNSDAPEIDDVAKSVPPQNDDRQPQAVNPRAARDKPKTNPTIRKRSKVKEATDGSTSLDKPVSAEILAPQPDKATVGDGLATERSAYFGTSITDTYDAPRGVTEESPKKPTTIVVDSLTNMPVSEVTEAASRRRLSWTPVKDSAIATLPGSQLQSPALRLTDILGNFGYLSNNGEPAAALERTPTGEAATKRRRIDLAVSTTVNAATHAELPSPGAQKPVKRTKAPKKKAQTITALATAAFQPTKDQNCEEPTVSEFFAPRKSEAARVQAHAEQAKAATKKPKKPRKSRAKATTADAQGAPAKPKKPSKARTSRVQFNEADHVPKLYSPARASARMKNQDFLFGTSSQLAVDETPTFIRDMQAALGESELMPKVGPDSIAASQTAASPKWKSCVKVPTAPHGTCLSVEQTERELWCVSSRDFKGGIWRSQKLRFQTATVGHEEEANAERSGEVESVPAQDNTVDSPAVPVRDNEDDAQANAQPVVVDLCNTSPSTAVQNPEAYAPSILEPEETTVDKQQTKFPPGADSAASLRPLDAHEDDSWMVLQSDEPEPTSTVLPDRTSPVMRKRTPTKATLSHPRFLSPIPPRPPLSPLNPNTSMIGNYGSEKHVTFDRSRALSYTSTYQARASSKSPTRRPSGRPPSDAAAASLTQISRKRRGRPPKQPALLSDPSPQPPNQKRRKAVASASQVVSPSQWLDIDEISDSDSPATPSPPRRRASSSPPAVQPLPLVGAGSPSSKAKAPALAAPTLKAGDPSWLAVRESLFPRITATVKSAPRSADYAKPSWWEKILLYDPIVLEDLTAWLNAQGLRFEVKKQKAKPKKKGRKPKDAEVEAEEMEWDVHEEELKPWMVQKWCEEKSICCLWKEGLRGGVRTRY